MHADLATYLPCDLLAKVDVTSMAHGLECRSPMLDHHVVELAMAIPFRLMSSGEGAKPLLTSAVPEIVPRELRNRDKMGFRIPLDHWFRRDLAQLAREIILGPQCLARGYFRPEALQQLFDEHESGRWNHGDRLWTLLCLEQWHRTFIDPAESPDGPCSDLPVVESHAPLKKGMIPVPSQPS